MGNELVLWLSTYILIMYLIPVCELAGVGRGGGVDGGGEVWGVQLVTDVLHHIVLIGSIHMDMKLPSEQASHVGGC